MVLSYHFQRFLLTKQFLLINSILSFPIKSLNINKPVHNSLYSTRLHLLDILNRINITFSSFSHIHSKYFPVNLSLINQTQTTQNLHFFHLSHLILSTSQLHHIQRIIVSFNSFKSF